MNEPYLSKASPQRKKDMRDLVVRWKDSDMPSSVLEESLRVLSNPGRSRQLTLMKRDEDVALMGITYVWGKGSALKGALSREDATALLGLVGEVKSRLQKDFSSEECFSIVIDRISSVILAGEIPPRTITDPLWVPVLNILRGVAPGATQGTLF